MIREINNFSVIKIEKTISTNYGNLDFGDESRYLFFNGRPTGKLITGDYLKQQYEIDGYYLIIMYYDGYDGSDCLYVTLIDKQFNKVAEKFVTHANGDLYLEYAVPIENDQVRMIFTNGSSVVLQICKIPLLPFKPFLRLKNWKYPKHNI